MTDGEEQLEEQASAEPTDPEPLQMFYRATPTPCPYLPGRMESKLFTRLTNVPAANEINGILTRAGFRRSHDILYRPICQDCAHCVPIRIPVASFTAKRTMARIHNRNSDLALTFVPAIATAEHYDLFARYQHHRHGDGDMSRMTEVDYAAMVQEGGCDTQILEARLPSGSLVAAILNDRLADGYSAVYSFFDPTQPRRSLGSFLILRLIEHARSQSLGYVYLGYWIANSQKMAYKTRFQPFEALGPGGWSQQPDAEQQQGTDAT